MFGRAYGLKTIDGHFVVATREELMMNSPVQTDEMFHN